MTGALRGEAGRDGPAAPAPADALLRVEGLEVGYAGVRALDRVTLEVGRRQVAAVIGANGAGKTSLVHAIVGVVPKRSGRVLFDGEDISRATPEALVRKGITLVPERRELFGALSVEDNLRLGAFLRADGSAAVRRDLAWVFETFPRLAERRRQHAGTMSGGEQQMLALGRALMGGPRLLLLDEPSLGLAPLVVQEILRVVAILRRRGVTVLLIEQNARAALRLANHGYVLEAGEVVASGAADELERDERVQAAYLGSVAPPG
ncbi:MAG TPA: ABC transporter ATP-binding protein [Trueperaceae bacterium]|nr:ABC transporter ATP-binding protein [Trueperaceae bacterium]